jgi:hypothetical protein
LLDLVDFAVFSAVSTSHLRLNTGRSQTPQTKCFTHAVVGSDLRRRFPSCAESDQAFARKEKGGTEPIGFLLLLIRVVTQEQQTRFRYFHAHWRMAQSKGAVYWHFENKEELFQAILEEIRARWVESVQQPLSKESAPVKRLAALFDCYSRLFAEAPETCLFLQRILLENHKEFSPQVARVFAQTARFIARIIDDGKARGMFRHGLISMSVYAPPVSTPLKQTEPIATSK